MADTPVPGPDDHDDTARLLDRLGGAAVDEAPPVPPTPAIDRRPRAPWLAAAAVAVVVTAVGGWFAIDRDDGRVATVPDTTTTPTTIAWPTDDMVALDFAPDPAATTDVLTATVTNRSSAPWSFDCKVGGLERWQDGDWTMVDFVMWADDGTLVRFDERPTLDCSPTAVPIEQGASAERPLDPSAAVRADQIEPLGPGRYQLLFADPAQFTGAAGQFELTESAATNTTSTTTVDAPDLTVADGDPAECMLVSVAELQELVGIDPNQPTGPVTMSPMPCRVADVNGEATYRIAPIAEARLAFDYPDVDDLGPSTVDGADESRVARFRSSGRTGDLVMGSVIVGGRAVVFSIGGTQSLDDDAAVRLATALAARLRG